MHITFYGAAQTVTGSQYLLQINGHQLLMECGLFQGRRNDFYTRNLHFAYDPSKLDAVLLSHAHIDHSGNLPNLVKNGYMGPIYATPATAHLCDIMLRDSGHIHEQDTIYVNKKRAKRGEPPLEPLYTEADAAMVTDFFDPRDYNEVFEPLPGVIAQLVDAGHILGSAAIRLDIEEKNGSGSSRKFSLWFSGDIGRRNLPIIRDPILPWDVDYLMMETTYGNKPHRSPEQAYQELRDVIIRTVSRRGKVIIPSFAVGRTQELVYNLHLLIQRGEIPSIPIFVDSPLATYATDIYTQHPECMDEETFQLIKNSKSHSAFGFDRLTYVRSVEESKSLNERKEPMVIISASGMAETGRILHHLKNNIENPRNTVLIVGWQSPYTLGRRIAEREKEVKIFGEILPLRAEVATIGGFSAHAGQDLLLEYAQAVRHQAKQIFLVHGEEQASLAFKERLIEEGFNGLQYPALGTTVEI